MTNVFSATALTGKQELHSLCHSLRLSNPYAPDSPEWHLWNDQCAFNIPILIQASLVLHAFCQTHKKQRILFTSRDGCHWIRIFKQLFPQYDSLYFHASREAYIHATPTYIDYVRGLYTENTVITDANGTGSSCELFFTTHLQVQPTYLAIVNCGEAHHAILRRKEGCQLLEMLNYDTCGLLYDVQAGKDLRYELEYPIECVLPMHACIEKCLELLTSYKFDTLHVSLIDQAIEDMQAGLAIERYVVHQVTSPRTTPIRSFDLFDTLLGRMHYRPDSIYELVEKLYPFPGFSFFRVVAECKSDHTLPGIYQELQKLIDLSEEEATKLMQFEFATELQYIFPILENISIVQDGDLIVSDTYYSLSQIKQLLEKLQLTQKVQIYATPQGKSSGTAWAFLKNNYRIESHLGDSLHADVTMAKLQKIAAHHYTNGQLSAEEQALLQKGQRDLSYLCRALRLSNPYEPNSAEWHLWNDQCKLNVPILIHASLYLHAFCQTHKQRRILFTARDGCLWIQVFRQMFPQYESIYFQSSRHVYMHASDSYVAYVRSLYNDETVIVDAQGKGASCEHFFKTHLQVDPTYLAIVNCGTAQHGIMRVETGCEQIEMLNYDTCGTMYDMQNGEALRRELEYPAWVVPPMHACLKKCVELLPFYHIDVFDQTVVESAVQAMRSGIALNQYLLHAYWHSESYHDFIKSIQQVKNSLFGSTLLCQSLAHSIRPQF